MWRREIFPQQEWARLRWHKSDWDERTVIIWVRWHQEFQGFENLQRRAMHHTILQHHKTNWPLLTFEHTWYIWPHLQWYVFETYKNLWSCVRIWICVWLTDQLADSIYFWTGLVWFGVAICTAGNLVVSPFPPLSSTAELYCPPLPILLPATHKLLFSKTFHFCLFALQISFTLSS